MTNVMEMERMNDFELENVSGGTVTEFEEILMQVTAKSDLQEISRSSSKGFGFIGTGWFNG